MVEEKIMFTSIDDVKSFAALANTKNYDVDITSGKYLINAKSIMGIFSLDLTKPLTLVAYCDDDKAFLKEIESYIYVDETSANEE
ncbi:MAG: HPr family phosphocarrier protein [Clostridia bacterium]|nr:HPr family phosphocarrier protein [Clostridia bacterium]MBR3593231.1 HPr family phosphocarrier protein [Clostridia bacterium]